MTWQSWNDDPYTSLRCINSYGELGMTPLGNGSYGAGAWPLAKRIHYYPFRLPSTQFFDALYCLNGGTQAGFIDLGIYTEDFIKIISSGSVANSGASTPQFTVLSFPPLPRGRYYIALSSDTTSATFQRVSVQAGAIGAVGGYMETPGTFGLPAVATPVYNTDASCFGIGIAQSGAF